MQHNGRRLEHQLRGELKPRARPPGTVPFQEAPQPGFVPGFQNLFKPGGQGGLVPAQPGQVLGGGGKGGIFSKEAKENAERAISGEGTLDPNHAYVQEKRGTRRALDQLGISTVGQDRIFVHDLEEKHGDAVTRVIAGETGLARGADITTDAPRGDAYADAKKTQWKEGAKPSGNADPSVNDFVQKSARNLVGSVHGQANAIAETRGAVGLRNDGKKTFMNMSHGLSPDIEATQIAARMMMAKEGTQLHTEAKAVLGHAPRLTELEGGGFRLNREDMEKLKRESVFPKLQTEMDTPEYKHAMQQARGRLEQELKAGREAGIMVFQAAGNEHDTAQAAGWPQMSQTTTTGVPGLFVVGATDMQGPGTADDQIWLDSGAGPVTASAPGVDIPVGVDDGKATNLSGTSFASPAMTETAYAMASANPNLSLDEIEALLKDPRVARDIEGTTRDGAGVVDQFAAVTLAKHPNLTRAQLDRIRAQLDANPNKRFTIGENGQLLPQ